MLPACSYANMVVRERRHKLFTSSTPAAIEVSRLVYGQLLYYNPSLYQILLPEYLDYYTTACIWMRMITIKNTNGQSIDEAEREVLSIIGSFSFCVPKPIMLQLEKLGNVVNMCGHHLFATFPTLPQEQIGGRGGYYGVLQPPGPGVDDSLHNLYEEIPCLGVLSEAIMNAISNAEPGPYRSVVTYEGLQPNQNLIGFRPLGHRHSQAKNVAFGAEITEVSFSEYPVNTAMNFELLFTISGILKNTKGFEVSNVIFSKLSKVGSVSQTVISRPLTTDKQINLLSTIRPTSFAKESPEYFGEAIFFCHQLMKESGPNADHTTWCMISPVAELPIPPQWVNNRNLRRNMLPSFFMEETFESTPHNAESCRWDIVRNMVTA
uniref:Uncharacterized protein n=1 Tax=Schizaphis graminum TaxID=13262 RepID=A0A2S2NZP7_SCHGA